MSLIPTLNLERLQRMTAEQVSNLPSLELVDTNGRYLGTLIVPPEIGGVSLYDEIKINAEYLGVQGNSALSTEKRELKDLGKEVDKYPHLAKARAIRRANLIKKRELVKV